MHTSERTSRWYGSLYRPERLFMLNDLMRRVQNTAWRSEDFGNAVWGKTAVTVTQNDTGTIAPDGLPTAALIEDTGASSEHEVWQYVNAGSAGPGVATTDRPLTFSVFVKKRDMDWIRLEVWDDPGEEKIQWFNIATGQLGTVLRESTTTGTEIQILDAGMEPYPHGWWRCWIVARTGTDPSVGVAVGTASQDGINNYVGTTKGFWVWGAQTENNKEFMGRYVRTTGSALTEEGVDFNGTPKLLLADGANSGTTGVKLSYTVPLNKRARVTSATMFLVSGTPTVQLRITRGGTVPVIKSFTATGALEHGLSLEAGDIIEWNVSASSAGSVDLTISVEEL